MPSTGGAERHGRNKSPYWGLVGAFGAMFCVGVLALGYANITHGQAEQAKAKQATEQCAADPNPRSCDDVIAVRAVVASEQAIRLGVWQAAFGFFGLAGLVGTVVFAGMAWREARRGAAAAERSVEIASDTAKKQLRAYLIISKARIEHIGNSRRRTLIISTNNYGATPATDVQVWRQVVFRSFPLREDFNHSYPKGLHSFRDIIGPGQNQSSHLRIRQPLTRAQIKGLVRGYAAYYVYGEIRYRDIFGDEHVTNFRFCSTGSRRGSMQADERGNDMS